MSRTYIKRAADKPEILRRVFAAAGNARKLARKLDIAPSAVAQWKHVPEGQVFKVAELTGIPVRELRPDLVHRAANFTERLHASEAA